MVGYCIKYCGEDHFYYVHQYINGNMLQEGIEEHIKFDTLFVKNQVAQLHINLFLKGCGLVPIQSKEVVGKHL